MSMHVVSVAPVTSVMHVVSAMDCMSVESIVTHTHSDCEQL